MSPTESKLTPKAQAWLQKLSQKGPPLIGVHLQCFDITSTVSGPAPAPGEVIAGANMSSEPEASLAIERPIQVPASPSSSGKNASNGRSAKELPNRIDTSATLVDDEQLSLKEVAPTTRSRRIVPRSEPRVPEVLKPLPVYFDLDLGGSGKGLDDMLNFIAKCVKSGWFLRKQDGKGLVRTLVFSTTEVIFQFARLVNLEAATLQGCVKFGDEGRRPLSIKEGVGLDKGAKRCVNEAGDVLRHLDQWSKQSPRFVSELQEKGDGLILSEKKTRAENKGHLGTLITIFGLILASVAFFMSLVDIKRGDRSNPMRGGGIVLTIGLALISTPTIIKMYTAEVVRVDEISGDAYSIAKKFVPHKAKLQKDIVHFVETMGWTSVIAASDNKPIDWKSIQPTLLTRLALVKVLDDFLSAWKVTNPEDSIANVGWDLDD